MKKKVKAEEMGRLIDADLLMEAYLHDKKSGAVSMVKLIEEAPTVDPVKHGHWVEENTRTHSMQFKCSECGRIAYYPQNHHSTEPKRCGYAYCPNCGSRMDGRKDDADE